jgi:hypothetical protein
MGSSTTWTSHLQDHRHHGQPEVVDNTPRTSHKLVELRGAGLDGDGAREGQGGSLGELFRTTVRSSLIPTTSMARKGSRSWGGCTSI